MAQPPNTVSLPGWENIIAIPKGTPPTREQYREYYRARREHRRPDLPDTVTSEIERRSDIRRRIESSATPDTAKAWTGILTALDDAQDLFSLVAFGGRLAVRPLFRALHNSLTPATTAYLLHKLPLRVFLTRLLPGLGWILLGADILKLLTLLASILQPFFVARCHGFSKGLVGALPALMVGNAAKLVGHGITGLNPFSRAARLARATKFTGKLFRVGELLEIAQASKTLTGYGLTLGGIMGTVTEAAYALELAARGQPVSIGVPGGGRIALTGAFGTATASGSPGSLSTIYDAMAGMMSNPTNAAAARAKADALRQYGY